MTIFISLSIHVIPLIPSSTFTHCTYFNWNATMNNAKWLWWRDIWLTSHMNVLKWMSGSCVDQVVIYRGRWQVSSKWFLPWKSQCWQRLWKKGLRHVWSSNDYLSDTGGEERIGLLDSSHFRLPPLRNLFPSLIQSSEIQAGHLAGAPIHIPLPFNRPLI